MKAKMVRISPSFVVFKIFYFIILSYEVGSFSLIANLNARTYLNKCVFYGNSSGGDWEFYLTFEALDLFD